MQGFISSSPLNEFFEKVVREQFSNRLNDHDSLIAAFKKHNAEVMETVPKDRLLVFEASQGWKPLCAFLGVPVPSEPFPRINTRDDQAEMREAIAQQRSGQAPDFEKLKSTIRDRFHSH